MTFPDDWKKFLRLYSFVDKEQVYTNGLDLIPVFRVEQLIEHLIDLHRTQILDLKTRFETIVSDSNQRLETIADIAIDYDGYRTAEDLMSLIDEMRDIALRGVPEEVTDDDRPGEGG